MIDHQNVLIRDRSLVTELGLQRGRQGKDIDNGVDKIRAEYKDEDEGKILPKHQRPFGCVLDVAKTLIEEVIARQVQTLAGHYVRAAQLDGVVGQLVGHAHQVGVELELVEVQHPARPVEDVEPVQVVVHVGGRHHRAKTGRAEHQQGRQAVAGGERHLEGGLDEAHQANGELLNKRRQAPQHRTEDDPTLQPVLVGPKRQRPVCDAARHQNVDYVQR